MTELVLGKGLVGPPQRESPVRPARLSEVHKAVAINESNVNKNDKVRENNRAASENYGETDADSNEKLRLNRGISERSSAKGTNKMPSNLAMSSTVEPPEVTNNQMSKAMWISPSTLLALNAATNWKSQVKENIEEEAESMTTREEGSEAEEDVELNTDTAIGKSVALLMGKSISKHRNIFDLMADTASKMRKMVVTKQNGDQELARNDVASTLQVDAQPSNTDGSAVSIAPEIMEAIKSTDVQSLSIEASETEPEEPGIANTDSSIGLKMKSRFKRKDRASPEAAVHHETQHLHWMSIRMGEGRFSFDDIEAKTQEQLIQQLRMAGDKTDIKKLQKESESKLRELLKARTEDSLSSSKQKESGAPFWRIEQMLKKRAPKSLSPSPETMKKWRHAAKKAGVPLEAFATEPLLNAWTSGKQHISVSTSVHQDAVSDSVYVNSSFDGSRPVEQTSTSPKSDIPRTVNPKHMDMLLNHKGQPSPEKRQSITVDLPAQSRLTRRDILWRKLCPN